MMKGVAYLALGVLLVSCARAPEPSPRPPASGAAFETVVEDFTADLERADVPGGAIAVVEGGQLTHMAGVGTTRAGGAQPVTNATRFRVASVSKLFTASAVMSLVESGELDLDAPITTYLPDLELYGDADPSQITTAQLLSHSAGIADFFEIACDTTLAGWFEAHPDLEQWSPAGAVFNYSNFGYSLAGLVAEAAGGVAFRDLVRARVFAPAGMSTATYDPEVVAASGDYATATPTPVPGARVPDVTLSRCPASDPSGYLYASARDLARYAEVFLAGGGAVLSPASVAAMAAPQAATPMQPGVEYGYGLFSLTYRGLNLVLHNGDLPGLHSAWVLVPERDFAVTVLVNGDGHAPLQTALEAVDRLLEPEAAPPTPTPPDPASWARYEGVYRDPLRPDAYPGALGLDLGDVEVRLVGDTLQARFVAFDETLPLTPLSGEFFYLEGTPFSVTFATGAEDGEDYLVVRGLGVARRDDEGEATRAARTPNRSLHTLSADYPQLTPPFIPFPTD